MLSSLRWTRVGWVVLGSLLCLAAGCLEIEHTIVLNADGSGRLTERVWVADWVLQAAKSNPDLKALPDLFLEKNACARMASYGGVTLVSHAVTDRGCHGQESTTVMSFGSINDVTLPAMLSGDANQAGTITFALGTKQKSDTTTFSGWNYSVTQPLRITQKPGPAAAQASMSPAERERWVRLLPVLRTLAKGLRISARLEAFGPVDGRPGHTLYEMTDKDLAAGDAIIDALVCGAGPRGRNYAKKTTPCP